MAEVVRLPARIDLGRPWKSFLPSQILERPPAPTWILDGLILAGEVTLLAGDTKIGKSLLAQQLLSCGALGLPCIGHHMERTRTFGYFCEDTNDWLVRRQFDICEALAIETSPDELDRIQHASDRDFALSNLERNSDRLREVRTALRRVEEGTFGICIGCEENINPKRLAAVPWASFCIVCQEAADQGQNTPLGEMDTSLAMAA
jgi:DnaK suppressor protein